MKIKIEIGQSGFGGIPFGEPLIYFIINDTQLVYKLEDLKNHFNIIWDNRGNRSEITYKSKEAIDVLFQSLMNSHELELLKLYDLPFTTTGEKK